MKIEDGISSHNAKIVVSAEAGCAYWESIAGALKLSERTGLPVELTHNAATVLVSWDEAVKVFAERLREPEKGK